MSKQAIEHYEKRAGGLGTIHIERLLTPPEMGNHVKMYAKVTIDVASSIGFHAHNGDGESYYVIQGNALYRDNEKSYPLHVGDVTFTPDGSSHGIENIGNEPLVIMALIIACDTTTE